MEAMHTYSVYQSYDVVPYVDSIVILYKDDTWPPLNFINTLPELLQTLICQNLEVLFQTPSCIALKS